MTILIVAVQNEIGDFFRNSSDFQSVKVIQYQHPLKAMDNIEELVPDIVLWNQDDFPRHWKTLLGSLRREDKGLRFYLISEHPFSADEIAKLKALGVEGYSHEGFFSDEVISWVRKHVLTASSVQTGTLWKSLPGGMLTLSQESSGVYLLSNPVLSRHELKGELSPGRFVMLPQSGTNSITVLVYKNMRLRLEGKVLEFYNNTLHFEISVANEEYQKFFDSLVSA